MESLKNILCPIDFSDKSENVLSHAVFLARLYKADITLLHVINDFPTIFGSVYGVDLNELIDKDSVTAKAENALLELKKKHVPFATNCEIQIVTGNTTEVIGETAQATQADLIMMGTDGVSGLESVFLGSNASKVVGSAPCPVITYGKAVEADNFKKILIPVTTFGIRELRKYYRHYFDVMSPAIELVTVVDQNPDEEEVADAQEYLNKEVACFEKESHTKVTTKVIQDDNKAEALIAHATENNFDLIMINTHGRGALGTLVMGSVSQEVVNQSGVPVLTVRPQRKEVVRNTYHSWFPV